jgi:Flp pilus assembly protein TadG
VEFALVLTLLLTLAVGVLDLGRIFYTQVGLTNAAREGARQAAQSSACSGSELSAIRSRVRAEQPGTGITDSLITVDCSQADRRTVTIRDFPLPLVSPYLGVALRVGSGPLLLTTWATMPRMTS